ncbi:DUF3082 domain-containing protein [Nodosilinea sp. P-1105]|uniref:DUF3082 domain-containing protein n=1 Tax=Nodosilinea sp. P-1105 TaxID=2546229 RepID=UPI00146AFF96|nr:DUF3082 domain-containing protein [Nodosilinea sp. P-1105]NMF83194.1 DUF3082 domain-containing protein [Nodosilinea sp. P-1105]
MADDIPTPDQGTPAPIAKVLKCFSGSLIAGTIALLAYRLTLSIAATFAAKPVLSDNPAVVNITAAVRTLVVGMVALGAGVFGLAALGLALLGLQLLGQRLFGSAASQ